MSPKPPRPRREGVPHPPTKSGSTAHLQFTQLNNFQPREILPDPERVARMREVAPELYTAFLDQFTKDAEHNREMQQRGMALDEQTVPALVRNDRVGIFAGVAVALGVTGLGYFAVHRGADYGWIAGVVGALPAVIFALKYRPDSAPDAASDDG